MPRGPKKHLKRLAAPKHWMLDKLTGTWVSVAGDEDDSTRGISTFLWKTVWERLGMHD